MLLILMLACSNSEYKTDLDNICHAEERAGVAGVDDGMKAQKMADFLVNGLKTKEARTLMGKLAGMDSSAKGRYLKSEAKKYGVEDCPLADQK
jgi:hypothetical protein